MNISSNGLNLIARYEGKRNTLYNDPVGHCTVGYGHLVHLGNCDGRAEEAQFANGLTDDQCLQLLKQDVRGYESNVNQIVRVPLNQNQFDALVSFTYNCGAGALQILCNLSGLNNGNYNAVNATLKQYVHGTDGIVYPGLVARRNEEAALFDTPTIINLNARTATVTASLLNVRNKPSLLATIVAQLPNSTQVQIISAINGWAQLDNGNWVYEQFIRYQSPIQNPKSQIPNLLCGIHDIPTDDLITSGKGTCVITLAMNDNPASIIQSLNLLISNNWTVILRFNWGYGKTCPEPHEQQLWLNWLRTYISALPRYPYLVHFCNEINFAREWEHMDITPRYYANLYTSAVAVVKTIAPQIKVAPAPLAWYGMTQLSDTWLTPSDYATQTIRLIQQNQTPIEWLALHAYHHDYAISALEDQSQFDSMPGICYNLLNYQSQLNHYRTIAPHLLSLPVHITECNPCADVSKTQSGDMWQHYEPGWMQALYAHFRRFNATSTDAHIHSVSIFRFNTDQIDARSYGISNHQNIISDWLTARASNN